MSLTPALFTSAKPDGADTSKLRPVNWNRVTGLLNSLLDGVDTTGSLLYRSNADVTDGAAWLPSVAVNSVLVSGGVGVAPAWSTGPTLANAYFGGTDSPANNVVEIRATNGFLAFKDAANAVQYGIICGGTTAAGESGVRIVGPASYLILQDLGGKTIIGGSVVLGATGTLASRPMMKRSNLIMQFQLADDSGVFTGLHAADIFANKNSSGSGTVLLGGLDADRGYGGLWIGQAVPSFTNYSILGHSSANQLLFNAAAGGDQEFRIANVTRLAVSASGASINDSAAPTIPLLVKNAARTTTRLSLTDAGQLTVVGLGAFVSGDKYVTIDASGNFHISAIGPAS